MSERVGLPTAYGESVAGGGEINNSLPISKLRGLAPQLRIALKQRRITTCSQLLRTAADADARTRLAREAGIDLGDLTVLVQRADMARVNGIGAVFGMMLEDLGIQDVAALAAQDALELHSRLRRYNGQERIARRSPTPEEVQEWVAQAGALAVLVGY